MRFGRPITHAADVFDSSSVRPVSSEQMPLRSKHGIAELRYGSRLLNLPRRLDTVLSKYETYAITNSTESANKHVLHCVNKPDVEVAVDAQLFAVDNNGLNIRN